jgi:hypothetical protein
VPHLTENFPGRFDPGDLGYRALVLDRRREICPPCWW